MSYQVGETLLMNWHGWLKAFRVVAAKQIDATHIEYQMQMLEMEKDAPQWTKPDV